MDLRLSFTCNGKVNSNDWELSNDSLFLRGEVENVLYPQDEQKLSHMNIQLFDHTVSATTALLDLKHFIKCMDMQLKVLSRHETYNQIRYSTTTDDDFYHIRCIVSQFILFVRMHLNSIKWNTRLLQIMNEDIEEDFNMLFVTIKCFLKRLHNIPDATFRYAPSTLGNQCTQPEYHMYHMHLELRWLFISLMYAKNIYCQCTVENQLTEFENMQMSVISDLIYISLKVFETIPLGQIQHRTPYNCTCVRELWLIFQVFTDSLSDTTMAKSFWEYVNECVNKMLNRAINDTGEESLLCKNSEVFCLWLIYNVSLLYGYNNDGIYLGSRCSRIRPNYEQLEVILKTYISKGGKDGDRDEIDEELRIMIPLLNTIVTSWWQPRVSIVTLLWDCFHKRLDKPFLLQVSGPWTIAVERKTATDILKQVKDRLNNADCNKESSYGMFLHLLGSILRIGYSNNDSKHWNQIKGRIYSKFSKSKVEEFSVSGIYNFISLFLTLAVTADTTSVCSVMLDLLPLTKEYNGGNSQKHDLIWKGKLALLLLYSDLKLSVSNIASVYVDTVNTICCRKDDTSRTMMSNFIDVFSTVLSSTNVELEEHLLLSGWIDRYLLECSNRMAGILINVLLNIFERCIRLSENCNTDSVGHMLDALWCYVACRMRQLVFNPALTSEHYKDISKLAVVFTLEAVRNPARAKKYKHSAVSLFQHFASSVIVKDIRVTRYYLLLILEQEQAIGGLKKDIKNFDVILIQAWIKCSIIGHDANENEMKVLQNYISKLNEVQEVFDASYDIREFRDSSESILIFMMHSMQKRNTLKTEQERNQYDIRWRLYLNHIEKWILVPITEETKDSEIALWIYRCIGTLVLCTSAMLYSKHQSNNMLKNLLNKTILAVEEPHLKNLGKKTFSMIVLGIEALDVKSDISLQVLIRDLFDQYIILLIIPNANTNSFRVSDSLLKCFKDAKADFICLIFEILMKSFFTVSSDNTIHKNATLIVVMLQNLLKGERDYACHIVEYVILICIPYIIECYVRLHDHHHPYKDQTIDLLNNIIGNMYYKQNHILREKFYHAILAAVQKSLLINQHNTFDLLRSMLRVTSATVEFLLPELESTLTDLEKYRRPNTMSFRYSLNQLQNLVKTKRV